MDGQVGTDWAIARAYRVCGAVEGVDRRIEMLAGGQQGAVARRQLRVFGLSRDAIDNRVKSRRLKPVHRGVYRVGPFAGEWLAESAAVLACGLGTALSHRSAAALDGAARRPDGEVHVTIVARHPEHRGITIHRTASLNRSDVRVKNGIPATTPLRTVLDLAAADDPQLEPILAFYLRHDLFTLRQITARTTPPPALRSARRGAKRLRDLIEASGRPRFTRSDAERRLLDLIRRARLPPPETNVMAGSATGPRHEVDLLWREQRLIVEVDGFAHHGSKASFHADRARDAELVALGYRVIRVTWRQLVGAPEVVIAQLAVALAV